MCHSTERRTANPKFRFANKLVASVVGCGLTLLLAGFAQAGSATWDVNPASGDWNTAINWTPATVPNGPADTATFDLSNTTDVSISANTEVNGITFTSAATNPYTITFSPGLTLTVSGVGITNNSGKTQDFNFDGTLVFTKSATAGNNVSILHDGSTNFFNSSTAGNASISNEAFNSTNFFNNSTAGNASFSVLDGIVSFHDNSNAGSAFYTGFSEVSDLQFRGRSTAGNATISSSGFISFGDLSTAGRAIISASGQFSFFGSSTGGTAQIRLGSTFPGSLLNLDIGGHDAPGVTIGSLAGSEGVLVNLGANNLTVGSNNLSTTFSGEMGGTGGSLTKIGPGTLILTGTNTYTGDTNVNRGVLQVDGSITSNTFVNHRGTLAGTGTVNGNVTNTGGTVSPGDPLGTLTVTGNYTQDALGALLINIAGTNTGQFSLLNVLGNADLDGTLNPVLLNGFTPMIGDSFTILDYADLTGAFSGIHNAIFNNGTERWLVTYHGTDAVLTATANTPDQASTLLLLSLSLLGVLTYRGQLLRKSA